MLEGMVGGGARAAAMQRLLVFWAPALLTAPRFLNGFVFDDVFVIKEGDFIHDLRNLPASYLSHAMIASSLNSAVGLVPIDTYRPFSVTTFFWDSALSGRAPWAYHLTNLIAHSVNCVLFLELCRKFVPDARALLLVATALCFGLSPWLAEAHVFINGRSDLFVTLFFLGAVLLQRSALAESRAAKAVAAGVLLLFALLSKEVAVLAAPLIVLVPVKGGVPRARRALFALPLAAAVLIYLGMRFVALQGLRTHADTQHLTTAFGNLPLLWADAVFHLALPSPYDLRNLRDDYASFSGVVRALAWLFLGGTGLVVAYAFRRRAYVRTWGLALALTTLAPVIMITTELWQGFGRYLYLPAVGIFLMLADVLVRLEVREDRVASVVRALPVGLAALNGLFLVDATFAFRDDLNLYTRAFARAPEQAWTGGSMGLAFKRAGRCDRAIPLLVRADELAPTEPRYAQHLARCLLAVGAPDRAREVARAGQERFHNTRAEASFLAAEFLTLERGSTDQAEALLRRCLELSPGRADCVEGLELVAAERAASTASGTAADR